MTPRLVPSADGTRIAVFTHSETDGPTVVAVHGFPDNHTVWDGVAARLGATHRVVSYDVRGAGASDKPRGRRAYSQPRLTEDLQAVLDEVAAPDRPVHLLGHDWGAIQTWASLARPEVASRVASFTAISGPSLDHAALWVRRHADARTRLRQVLTSTYMGVFQLPVLPELAARTGVIGRGVARSGGEGVDRGTDDAAFGVNLYRANLLPAMVRPNPPQVEVPTLVLVPTEDQFVSTAVASESPVGHVTDLTVQTIPGRHWVVSRHPERVSGPVATFVGAHDGARR